MALYNNPYQYSFGVPGQMNQFQQQPVQMPTQPVQQPQQNNNGILWVSGEVGAKSYLVAPGTSVLLMDSESEKFYIKSTDVSGMPQPLRTFEYHEVGTQMPPKQPVQNMDSKYVTRQEYNDLKGKYEANTRDIIDSQNAGTRAILDYLCNEKISSLQAENNDLRRAASQDRQSALLTTAMASQTQQLINAINPAPIPAYQVPNPNTYYGCGCNTGCNC